MVNEKKKERKKFSADTESFHGVLEIEIDGREYEVERITKTMLDRVNDIQNEAKDNAAISGPDVVVRQTAALLDIDPGELAGTDIRKIVAVFAFIMEQAVGPAVNFLEKRKPGSKKS